MLAVYLRSCGLDRVRVSPTYCEVYNYLNFPLWLEFDGPLAWCAEVSDGTLEASKNGELLCETDGATVLAHLQEKGIL